MILQFDRSRPYIQHLRSPVDGLSLCGIWTHATVRSARDVREPTHRLCANCARLSR